MTPSMSTASMVFAACDCWPSAIVLGIRRSNNKRQTSVRFMKGLQRSVTIQHVFSRGAAKECSHGREPVGQVQVRGSAPEGRKTSVEAYAPNGAISSRQLFPRARARGYTLSPLRG